MARVLIPSENRTITDVDEIVQFLKPYGIWYEYWATEGRLGANPTDQEILETYADEIQALKDRGAFVTADVINVNPQTPGLDAMLQKFNKEHTHSEDEVRFTVSGRGLFHIHADNDDVFAIEVESGDMINVPHGMRHWFNLCDDRNIRCIRLFEDKAGWTPEYIDNGVHGEYQPLCMGPNYLANASNKSIQSVIQP
jgi:1,2-dihydroxy-3-keto-5-methylthiopentene dioxygenase